MQGRLAPVVEPTVPDLSWSKSDLAVYAESMGVQVPGKATKAQILTSINV